MSRFAGIPETSGTRCPRLIAVLAAACLLVVPGGPRADASFEAELLEAERLLDAGDLEVARLRAESLVDVARRRTDLPEDTAAKSLRLLAHVYRLLGEDSKALPLYEDAVSLLERAHGAEGVEVAVALVNLAGAKRALGDLAGARTGATLDQVLSLLSERPGDRDLETQFAVRSVGEPLVVAAPDYGKGEEPRHRAALGGLPAFEALPGTRDEADAVAALLGAELLLGARATETAVKGVHGPRVLHIATHGFFLEEPSTRDPPGRGVVVQSLTRDGRPVSLRGAVTSGTDPLIRSGLALAGANGGASGGDRRDPDRPRSLQPRPGRHRARRPVGV